MTSDSSSSSESQPPSRGCIIWLEDDPREERVLERKEELEKLGFKVLIAEGFRELEYILRQNEPTDPSRREKVRLIVIDIMLVGVRDLSVFFPWVSDANTDRGFAAGLVFLERVLFPSKRSPDDTVFGKYQSTPVIVYSTRTLPDNEKERVDRIARSHGIRVEVLAKATVDSFVRTVEDIVKPLTHLGPEAA